MKVVAGVLVTDERQLLLGHSTNNNFWDIPKGAIELGESPINAAIRELKEETGIVVYPISLIYLGNFNYIPNVKRIELFKYHVINLPSTLFCESTFEWHSQVFPEFDKYKYVKYNELQNYVTKNMYGVLIKILNLRG